MVKAVTGEETRLQLAEDRLSQSGASSQVGLVVGKLSSNLERGLVFDLIPTPTNDAGEPACSLIGGGRDDKKKGSKGKSQSDSSTLFIDKDWVAEHARQVSKMLLGGIKVLGIYIWMNESSFKSSTILLCETAKGVAEAAPSLETDWDERLLIHISYSPRRWTCRNCTLASNITSSSLRPCDFKMGRVLSSLQVFRCTYTFDLRLPVCRDNGSNFRKLADILRHGISSHAKELKGAKAVIDGNLVVEDSCISDGLHEVQFLLPFMKESFVEACSQKEVVGVLVFSGSVCSFAYLNSKELLSQALADLKGDIIMSLLSRLDIICDEADIESGLTADGGKESSDKFTEGQPFLHLNLNLLRLVSATYANAVPYEEVLLSQSIPIFRRKQCSLFFPRRVFVPWLADTYICDYLQPCETIEVVKDHCVELMSMEALTDASKILEPEVEPPTLSTKSFWDVSLPFSSASGPDSSSSKRNCVVASKENEGKSTKSADFNIMTAALVLILAVILGALLYFVRAS